MFAPKLPFSIMVSSLFLVISLLMSGCEMSPPSDSAEKINEASVEKKHFRSVTDYHQEINGQNLKNSVLGITKQDGTATLEMTIHISDYLIDKMLNTEEPYYFTYGDMPGEKTIAKLLVESPSVLTIELNRTQKTYTISQQIKLKESLSVEEEQALLSPQNYVLQVLNEEKLAVSTFIGLDIATIIE